MFVLFPVYFNKTVTVYLIFVISFDCQLDAVKGKLGPDFRLETCYRLFILLLAVSCQLVKLLSFTSALLSRSIKSV